MDIDELDLSKRELLDLMQLVHDALLVKTDQELTPLLLQLKNLIPCEHIIVGMGETNIAGHLQNVVKIINISYPTDWLSRYQEKNYAAVDPVLRTHAHRFGTQLWSETFANATSKLELAFIEDARAFGLGQGITIGQPNKRKLLGSLFSFSGKEMGSHKRHQMLLEYVLPHLHLALMRTAYTSESEFQALSPREREVLQWLMEGKTNWETARILSITERTVKFHVQNVLAKLHSSTRGHAIALAIELGLIGSSISSQETEYALKYLRDETDSNRELPLPIQPGRAEDESSHPRVRKETP